MTDNLERYVAKLTELRAQREATGWVPDDDELLTDELHGLWDVLTADERSVARELSIQEHPGSLRNAADADRALRQRER